jgi:hypothetical protein
MTNKKPGYCARALNYEFFESMGTKLVKEFIV